MNRIVLKRAACSVVILLAASTCATGAEPAKLPETTPWDVKSLGSPPSFKWLDTDGAVHSLTYRSEPFHGQPTSVFAYYASPVAEVEELLGQPIFIPGATERYATAV